MTAEELFGNYFNGMHHDDISPEKIIVFAKVFAKLKCKEQREICAENAQMEIYTNRDDMSYLTDKNSNTVWEDYNDGKSYTEYQKVYEIGIINSPEPVI